MPGKYTLSDTIYKKYLQDVKELFTSKLLNLIEEIPLKDVYDYILGCLETFEESELETLYDGRKALKFCNDNEWEEFLITANEKIDDVISDVLKTDKQIYSIKIADRVYKYNVDTVIYFDESCEIVLISERFIDNHKYILIKDKKIVEYSTNEFDDWSYYLLILSVMGDLLFDFEE